MTIVVKDINELYGGIFLRFKNLILLLVLGLLLTACGTKVSEDKESNKNSNIETTMSEKVRDFDFINQDEEPVSLDDLKGNYWIADFIFTNCETVCLPMTKNMSILQDMVKDEGIDMQFISFSIDPDNDSPEALKEYGEGFDADFNNWSFLTGYEFDEIREFSIKSFKSMVQMPADEDNDQIIHGTSFYLVDPEGKVIKGYPGVKADDMKDIFKDIKKLH